MSIARITAFNNLLIDILSLVEKHFPGDKDLEYTKSQIELALSFSPGTTIASFMRDVKPYLEKIHNKDEHFFKNIADKEKSLKGLSLGKKWDVLEKPEREKVWRNVQKMIVLGDRILNDNI